MQISIVCSCVVLVIVASIGATEYGSDNAVQKKGIWLGQVSDLAKKKPASPSVGVPVIKLPVVHNYRRPSGSGSSSDNKGRRHRKGGSSSSSSSGSSSDKRRRYGKKASRTSGSSSDKRRRYGKKGSRNSGSSSDNKSGGRKYRPVPSPVPIVKLPVPVVKATKY